MSDIVRMPKRFDYSSGSDFNAALLAAIKSHKLVNIDCSDMEYIDGAGIGLLVLANKQAQAQNSKLTIVNLRSAPREILQLANLQKIIDIR